MEGTDDGSEDFDQAKIKTKIYRSYDEKNLKKAMQAVVDGDMKIAQAAREFFVPRKTLDDRIKGKVSLDARSGRKHNLTRKQEKKLVKFLHYIGKRGYPLNRQKMRPLVRCFARLEGPSIFTCDGPSDQWFRNFYKRHPTLKIQGVQRHKGKKSFQEAEIGPWFSLLQKTMRKLELSPARIYNCGETTIDGIDFDSCQDIQLRGPDRVTCVDTVCADGHCLPTMLVYKDTFPHESTRGSVPADWLYASSSNGFLSYDSFNQWFEDIFLAAIGPDLPVLLILSDTEQHANYTFVEYAKQENVEVLYFPAHVASQVQPLDVSLFPSIRRRVTQHAHSHRLVFNQTVNRTNLAMLWHAASQDICTPEAVKNSFSMSGMKPITKHPRGLDDRVSTTSARTSGVKSLPRVVSSPLTPESGFDGDIQLEIVVPVANVPVPAEMVVISNETCHSSLDHETWTDDPVVMTADRVEIDGDSPSSSGNTGTVTGSDNSGVLATDGEPQEILRPKRKKSQTKARIRKVRDKPQKLVQKPNQRKVQKRRLAVYGPQPPKRKVPDCQQVASPTIKGLKFTIKKDTSAQDSCSDPDSAGGESGDTVGPEDEDEEVCWKCFQNWPCGQNAKQKLSWTKCSKCCRWFHNNCIELDSKIVNYLCADCDDYI